MIKIVAKTNNVDDSIIDNMKFLAQIRTALLNDSVAKEICNDNGMGEWFLTAVPIRFEELPVSAKTQEGSIVLNSKLKKFPFPTQMRYVIHELVHAVQHALDKNKDSDNQKEYLDRSDELEAFQYQIKFDVENNDEDIEEYIEGLLDHHDLDGSKKKEKRKELLDKV